MSKLTNRIAKESKFHGENATIKPSPMLEIEAFRCAPGTKTLASGQNSDTLAKDYALLNEISNDTPDATKAALDYLRTIHAR